MLGGSLVTVWKPYIWWATVDYIYGWPAWNAHNGFTSAQGVLNIMENFMYIFYLWTVAKYGRSNGTKGKSFMLSWWFQEEKTVPGVMGALGELVAFAATVTTLSKTILYCE